MEHYNKNRPRDQGFTMVEMIGVLAVIGILTSLLMPKIMNAINDARINNVVASYNTIKTATTEFFGKFNRFCNSDGTDITLPLTTWDTQLLAGGFIDKKFKVKIGTTATVECIACLATGSVDGTNAGYDLDGAGVTGNEAGPGQMVLFCKIVNVPSADAKEINDRIDDTDLGSAVGLADLRGRVKYAAPPTTGATAGLTTVYMYLAHK